MITIDGSLLYDINSWRTQARATQQRDIEQNRAEARDLREKVAQDLLMLSRDLQGKDALQRRVTELQRSLERVPLLEKELQKTQKDLKVCQLPVQGIRLQCLNFRCRDAHVTGRSEAVESCQVIRRERGNVNDGAPVSKPIGSTGERAGASVITYPCLVLYLRG